MYVVVEVRTENSGPFSKQTSNSLTWRSTVCVFVCAILRACLCFRQLPAIERPRTRSAAVRYWYESAYERDLVTNDEV